MRLLPLLVVLLCPPLFADDTASVPTAPTPVPTPAPPPEVSFSTMTLPTPIDYGILVVSRERLEVSTPCDIGIYLQGNLAARLFQGQSVTLNLPPGEVMIRLGSLGGGSCAPRFEQLRSQTVQVSAGEVHRFRIAMYPDGMVLIPAPQNY